MKKMIIGVLCLSSLPLIAMHGPNAAVIERLNLDTSKELVTHLGTILGRMERMVKVGETIVDALQTFDETGYIILRAEAKFPIQHEIKLKKKTAAFKKRLDSLYKRVLVMLINDIGDLVGRIDEFAEADQEARVAMIERFNFLNAVFNAFVVLDKPRNAQQDAAVQNLHAHLLAIYQAIT